MEETLITVRGTELLAGDPRDRYRQKLARITLDSMVQFVGLLNAKGTVLEINQVALAAGGITLADVEGKPFWSTFWWQVSDEINATLREMISRAAAGEFVRWDTPIYRRAGGTETIIIDASLSPVRDDDGKVVFITAEGRDITEKNAHERAVAREREKQNERLRLLWEAAGILLSTDEPDAMLRALFGKIRESLGLDVYFNYMVTDAGDALQLISYAGISDEGARGIARLEFGDAICGKVALRRSAIVATHIQESSEKMVQLVKGFGVRAYACNPLIAGTRLLGTLSFSSRTRDEFDAEEIEFMQTISQYVTVAYERLHLIDQLRDQDRRKDEFLATLAHELRNPLAPIRNGLQLMRLADNDPATLLHARSILDRQVQQMVRLVDDLLDVSRINSNRLELKREWVELATVIKSAVETSRPTIEAARHELSVSLPAQPVLLDADPLRLAQALSNLLNNAAKYTESGGSIALVAEQVGEDVVIRVRDSGIGISPDTLPHIFRMFVQSKDSLERSQGGLGIGLTLVKRLVEMHGGAIEARSEGPGKGSEFSVRLPVLVVPMATEATSNHRLADVSRADVPRRILVVDDNRDSADSLTMMLKLLGHDVATAYEGVQGVDLVRKFRPQLALFDLGMPRLNGYDAARRIRASPDNDDVMLVALSGWGQESDTRRTREAGFNAHMVKPVDIAALEKLLTSL